MNIKEEVSGNMITRTITCGRFISINIVKLDSDGMVESETTLEFVVTEEGEVMSLSRQCIASGLEDLLDL